MKRDMDLVRRLLLAIEQNEDNPMGWLDNYYDGEESPEVISYHIALLADADLVNALDASSMSSYRVNPSRLTWQGHEFLDKIRDEGQWSKIKAEALKAAGGLSLFALQTAADLMIRRALGQA